MYGWRARIGLVIPANNNVVEPELSRVIPTGVSLHASRMRIGNVLLTPEAVRTMERNADRALAELLESRVNVVAYACVATSVVKGRVWDEGLRRRLQDAAPNVPVQSAATAVVEALQQLGARRVAVATPYPPELADLVADYFLSWGIDVVHQANLPTEDVRAVCDYPPDRAYRLARGLDVRTAEAVAILATDFRALDVVAALEADLRRPVVATNLAMLWWALRAAGVREDLSRLGQLMTGSSARSADTRVKGTPYA